MRLINRFFFFCFLFWFVCCCFLMGEGREGDEGSVSTGIFMHL